ncbi:hypothetical protein RIR_jg33873.t1 [Rhizophagus irregularis DAOM 181602=DAOM 197198]|nr:hypothetical protein RIR_jg33873.t1 [Rhizophagus irregularis DAOM 181602=DAOM 197198]
MSRISLEIAPPLVKTIQSLDNNKKPQNFRYVYRKTTDVALTFERARASGHLVRYSVATTIYLFPCKVVEEAFIAFFRRSREAREL